MKYNIKQVNLLLLLPLLQGCYSVGAVLNPFQPPPSPEAELGSKNDHALNETTTKSQNAREALEAMSTYQRTQLPQPNNPVMQPAVVRLMWVPDHLNSNGDLIPAHYYYLKVLKERWAVTDAFELEKQLGSRNSASSVPYVSVDSK